MIAYLRNYLEGRKNEAGLRLPLVKKHKSLDISQNVWTFQWFGECYFLWLDMIMEGSYFCLVYYGHRAAMSDAGVF